jgi:hypothetical protein
MAEIKEARVTTTDSRKANVRVECDDGTTQLILADRLLMPSSFEPATAKLQVADQLKKLAIDLPPIEPDRIIIEWTRERPAK